MPSTLPSQTNRKVDEQSTGKDSRPRWLGVAGVVAAEGCRYVLGVCLDSLGFLLAGPLPPGGPHSLISPGLCKAGSKCDMLLMLVSTMI